MFSPKVSYALYNHIYIVFVVEKNLVNWLEISRNIRVLLIKAFQSRKQWNFANKRCTFNEREIKKKKEREKELVC